MRMCALCAELRADSSSGRYCCRCERYIGSVHAHELLHKSDRDKPLSRTVLETEAEAVAFVACQAIGLEAAGAAADYIHLYQGSKETLLESLQGIREAAVEIVKAITAEDPTEDRAKRDGRQAADADLNGSAHAA